MFKKIGDKWKQWNTPYSERSIDYLKNKYKEKVSTGWLILFFDILTFIVLFIFIFNIFDIIIINLSKGVTLLVVVVLLFAVIAFVFLVWINLRMFFCFVTVEQEANIIDVMIYLKRLNKEYETNDEEVKKT